MGLYDWKEIAQILPVGLFRVNADRKIELWNSEMERLSGFPAAAKLQTALADLELAQAEHPRRVIDTLEFFGCLFSKQSETIRCSVHLKTMSGEPKLVFLQAKLSDNPALIFVTVSDLSAEIYCAMLDQKSRLQDLRPFYGMVGENLAEVFRLVRQASASLANVLISGESGTGKELVAKAIHFNSNRREGPFVTVNCAALSESLLESELFGHVKGSFTGAFRDKKGKFEEAHTGTLFLDEIGEINENVQVKLLRVIQSKTFERIGDNKPIRADFRIITATNRLLRDMVKAKTFREDLYYRLKVFPIHVPPLRDRKADIPHLTQFFISQFNLKTGKSIQRVSAEARRLLENYCWPGNIRELENSIEYAFAVCEGNTIESFDLPPELRPQTPKDNLCEETVPKESGRKTVSRDELISLLGQNQGNKTRTAQDLGISRVTLWKRLKSLGITGIK